MRGGVPRPVDLAGRRPSAAGSAAAVGRLRGHRLLGLAERDPPGRSADELRRNRAQPHLDRAAVQPFRKQRRAPARRPPRLCGGRGGAWLPADRDGDALRHADEHGRGHRHFASDHRGGGLADSGAQPLWPGVAGEPLEHPARHARAVADLELRPQLLHDRLSRQPPRAGPVRMAWSDRRGHCANVCDGRQSRGRLAHPALACGDLPVALVARDLRLFRDDGDPRHRSPRDERRMVARASGRSARCHDRRRHGAASQHQGPKLGQG